MKQRIKRLFALVLAVMMVLCVVGCEADVDINVNVSSAQTDSSDDTTTDKDTSSGAATSESTSSKGQSTTSSNASSSKDDTADNNTGTDSYEKPYEGNSAILYNKQTSKYDAQAETLRQSIVNAKDSGLKGSTTYYVSYKGNDRNSGTSPDSPWATISKVNNTNMSNAVVLFERGGVYRGSLELKSFVSYGAYGSGPKPCIYGSKKNYADESLWKKSTSKTGAWEIKLSEKDVGQIVFDHGKKVATKASNRSTEKEYIFIYTGGTLYLYVPDNPAKLHNSIEISGYDHILYSKSTGAQDITVENLCIKYGGRHGMSFAFTKNITIRNCEVGYIGGVGGSVPLGNGIEFWLDTDNVIVENCWVYQCFDAGITNQGQRNDGKKNIQQNITYKDNLIEYCIYGIEYFAGQGKAGSVIKNTLFTGNIIRFSGLGWSKPGAARIGETDKSTATAAINGWATNPTVGDFPAENFVIENNILDTSWKYLISLIKPNESGRVIVRNNTYYQKKGNMASIWYVGGSYVLAENDSQFKAEIAKIDQSPKLAELVD